MVAWFEAKTTAAQAQAPQGEAPITRNDLEALARTIKEETKQAIENSRKAAEAAAPPRSWASVAGGATATPQRRGGEGPAWQPTVVVPQRRERELIIKGAEEQYANRSATQTVEAINKARGDNRRGSVPEAWQW